MADKKTINLRNDKNMKNIDIENIYESGEGLKNISRPTGNKRTFLSGRALSILIFMAIVLVFGFFYYQDSYKPKREELKKIWYSVKLVDGEIYYGQINDVSSDPIAMKNVYYDYDQLKNEEKSSQETGNIRLVKRGQETHGPSGAMYISWAQILIVEPLGKDSKVLKAILGYEK